MDEYYFLGFDPIDCGTSLETFRRIALLPCSGLKVTVSKVASTVVLFVTFLLGLRLDPEWGSSTCLTVAVVKISNFTTSTRFLKSTGAKL
jgi:hypothetical protein